MEIYNDGVDVMVGHGQIYTSRWTSPPEAHTKRCNFFEKGNYLNGA